MTHSLRIGARGSPLSLAQTRRFQARLAAHISGAPDTVAPILPITTTGDKITDRRLIEAGGKGLFTKELDEALLEGRIDLAVHSMKDLPTKLPAGIVLACVPERIDARDAFISAKAKTLMDLPQGAVLGTASLRRQAQALHVRPDLQIVTLRGNVDTRLRKLAEGEVDAMFLALAGLLRLNLADKVTSLMDPDAFPPAAGQGALAITARADDARTLDALAPLNDFAAAIETAAERGFLAALDGSCRTPIAAHARYDRGAVSLRAEALTPNGAKRWRQDGHAHVARLEDAEALGARLGMMVREEAGALLLADY
jgi:hydroxymethylbilane synthase